MGLPLAAVFAAAQVYICKKSKSKFIKFLLLFCGAGGLLLAEFIKGENLLASAVYGMLGQGIFALVVILWIFGFSAVFGAGAGFAVFLIRKKIS